MSRQFTPKPCPGCGQMKPISPSTVCKECKDKLRQHDELRALAGLAEDRRSGYAIHMGEKAAVPSSAPSKHDSTRAFASSFGDFLCHVFSAERVPDNERAAHGKVSLFGYSNEPYHFVDWSEDYQSHAWRMFMPKGTTEKLHGVYRAINGMLRASYEEGRVRGQDLLAQLNSGEITLDRFEDFRNNRR